jgi:tRNA(adenine34) deaminase
MEERAMSVEAPTSVDERMIGLALEEAHRAMNEDSVGVAAVLARGEEVIVVARNSMGETGDMTDHAEMVALRRAARALAAMSDEERRSLTMYVTLEPCLMCAAALSFVGIKRVAYAALAGDMNEEEQIVRGLDLPGINERFVRGPMTLLPGVRREEGRALIRRMGKEPGAPTDMKT